MLHFKVKVSAYLQEKSAFFKKNLFNLIKGTVCNIYWHLVGRNNDAYKFKNH